MRAAEHRPLDPPVLIAERDLEVEDVLAVTLKAKVTGLDHAGVHGPDGHLVHLVALDAIEVRHSDLRDSAVGPREHLVTRPIGSVVADRLEPRVSGGAEAELLRDLALEQVELRASRGQRLEPGASHEGPAQVEARLPVVREHDEEADRIRGRLRHAEEGGDAQPGPGRIQNLFEELGRRELRHG